jgi:linoleoyl-CoA desaturase
MRNLKYKVSEKEDFFQDLKKDVFEALVENYREEANIIIGLKSLILLSIFSTCLLTIWFASLSIAIYLIIMTVLGVTCLPLILNIGHEAVHRNFSTNKNLNKYAKGVFFLLGTSAYFWELRHNSSHHAFANVKDVDLDIEQTNIIRLSEHQKLNSHHKYQHLYMPFAFCFYTLLWFFVRDFKDLGKKHFGAKTIKKHPIREVIKLLIAKIWHLLVFLVIPYMTLQNLGLVIIGFFVFHLTASIVTTFALISTHVGEVQEIVNPDDEGKLPYSWAEHQLMTTADFNPSSWVALHFFAGFNHHVAHHLFPQIPHVYYPKITPLIRKHAKAHGLTYNYYPNLITCAKSHFKRLKHLSTEI